MRNAVNLRRLGGLDLPCDCQQMRVSKGKHSRTRIINSVASRIKRIIPEDGVGSTILAPEAYSEMKLIIDNLTGMSEPTDRFKAVASDELYCYQLMV